MSEPKKTGSLRHRAIVTLVLAILFVAIYLALVSSFSLAEVLAGVVVSAIIVLAGLHLESVGLYVHWRFLARHFYPMLFLPLTSIHEFGKLLIALGPRLIDSRSASPSSSSRWVLGWPPWPRC
jgi:hypothetical protein